MVEICTLVLLMSCLVTKNVPFSLCMTDALVCTCNFFYYQMHLRALFNYDPADDLYIPCQELGFAFIKGDILHVVQLNDASWWQAHRDNEDRDTVLAGLIPSKSFQEQ